MRYKRRKPRRAPAIIVALIMFLVIGVYACFTYSKVKPADGTVCEGVYIEGIEVSGMTEDQMNEKMNEIASQMSERTLSVNVNGKAVDVKLDELGYTYQPNDYASDAMKLGREGDFFNRYSTLKSIQKNHKNYKLKFKYSKKKLKKFVKDECGKECVNAKNASVKMKNGHLVYTKSKDGVEIDANKTISDIMEKLDEEITEDIVRVDATVKVEKPDITLEEAKRCKDKIGTFTTQFNAGNISRSKNVANAARLINNHMLMPGEVFSVHDTISPLTEENGYYAAASYNQGKVEDTIGGGICQVSTTLYNAVLRAELQVVSRSPHSMAVTYVKPSMDAAMAGDYKDFKFKNNTNVPIYIVGGTYSGNIYFTIYGEETRDPSRKISFESEVLEELKPGADKIIYDSTLPAGSTQVTQEAHTGYKAVLWKIVKENGKKTKTQVNQSTYQPSPRFITKGTKPVQSVKPTQTQAPDGKQNKKDNKDSSKTSGQTDDEEPATVKEPKKVEQPSAQSSNSKKSKPEEEEE